VKASHRAGLFHLWQAMLVLTYPDDVSHADPSKIISIKNLMQQGNWSPCIDVSE
jgi:hypothetical protein